MKKKRKINNKIFTAGELAEMTGVSSRTIRFYDKKGLLKPIDYSGGGYRLYNEDSILQLQTIRMLQYIGLPLEKIKDYLQKEENIEFKSVLWKQKLLLEEKKHRMEQMISTLNEMFYDCQMGMTGENEVKRAVDILQLMNMEEEFDYRYLFYKEYSTKGQEWFQWIFDRLELFEGVKVLDMGCGRGNIWIKNWERIPQDATIILVDKRHSVIEYLECFYQENKRFLQKNVQFKFINQDLETDFSFREQYDRIVADHLWTYISNPERLMKEVNTVLKPNGFMHSTYNSYGFMEKVQQLFEKVGIPMDLNERIRKQTKERIQLESCMEKCFRQVKCSYFENRVSGIEHADTILQYIRKHDLQIYTEYCDSWKEYEQKISRELQENGAFEAIMMEPLYRCSAFHDLE